MQIQEHLEAKVACKSALCSHLIGARAAAPRANTCFLQPLKNRVAYFSLFFSSLSLSLFSPLLCPSSLCFPSIPSTVSSRYCSLSAHDFGKHRSTRIYFHANRATEWHTVCRQAERFSWQISNRSGLQRVETREREREEKKPPQRRSLSNFFPSLDSKPLSRNTATRAPPPSPLIRERVSRAGGGKGGKGKKSASTVKTTNPIPGPRIDHRDD